MDNPDFDIFQYLKDNERMNILNSDISRSLKEGWTRDPIISGVCSLKENDKGNTIKSNIQDWIAEHERRNLIHSSVQDRIDQHDRVNTIKSNIQLSLKQRERRNFIESHSQEEKRLNQRR
jgi:hypothetical protein